MVQQSISTPEELFHFQLRSAFNMEDDSMQALQDLEKAAQSKEVRGLFTHHQEETREQIDNLNKVFDLFEYSASTAPTPATTGIKNQAKSLLERTDPALHDQVTLMSAMGNEHFEIAMYQGLIVAARTMKVAEAVSLLEYNLEQEKHTSKELRKALKKITK